MMDRNARIYVAGHNGMIGRAIVKQLTKEGFHNIIVKDREDLNLTDQTQVKSFFDSQNIEYAIFAAGRTGGIYANQEYSADFIYDNLAMQNNFIYESFIHEIKKLVFISCSCVYPKLCNQPMKESYLFTGEVEKTNDAFAEAKLAGMKMCECFNRQYGTNFISVIPTNTYGLNQSYDEFNALVVPALIQNFHRAKCEKKDKIIISGTGKGYRDFIFADDLAHAISVVLKCDTAEDYINIGTGKEITIALLAEAIKRVVEYEGEIVFDSSKGDGVMRKLQDIERLKSLGWAAETDLEEGLRSCYKDYLHALSVGGGSKC